MRLSAYAFALETDRLIEGLTREEFHLRKGNGKVLQEEWYPIARLGLHLKHPGLNVQVEAFGDKGAADGHIVESGYLEREFDVQVTYVHDYEESLRREMMLQVGFAPGAGPIVRNRKKGTIDATLTVVDSDYYVRRAAKEIVQRFEAKKIMPYRTKTILLIAFEELSFSGRGDWANLFHLIDQQAALGSSNFKCVYILNCASNEIARAA